MMPSLLCVFLPIVCAIFPADPIPEPRYGYVSSVVDGDTVRIVFHDDRERGSWPVRLIGIDAPEYNIYQRIGECHGKYSTDALSLAVNRKSVRVELDDEHQDRYRRTLAYLWDGSVLVNEQLARDGHVRSLTIRPNVRYAERIRAAVSEARAERRGLWGACP